MDICANNDLGPEGGKAIGKGISQLKQLSSLIMHIKSYIGSEGCKAIGDGLSALE